MAETEEKKPFESAVRSWQDMSDAMVNNFGRLAEAWTAANVQFLTGAIHASANLAIDFSESLAAVPSKRREMPEGAKADLSQHAQNRMEDAVNVADVVAHSVTNGMQASSKVLNDAWEVFANRYHSKSAT